jgi:hypothetical protein
MRSSGLDVLPSYKIEKESGCMDLEFQGSDIQKKRRIVSI